MAIKSEEITSVIQKQLEGFEGKLELSEVGLVLSAGDGIARIYGLKKALAGELLELPNNVYGMVMNLEADTVGCVLFGDDRLIKEGDSVKRTGKVMEVPVGDAMIGRVVNPLGQPIDGKGPIKTTKSRLVEIIHTKAFRGSPIAFYYSRGSTESARARCGRDARQVSRT